MNSIDKNEPLTVTVKFISNGQEYEGKIDFKGLGQDKTTYICGHDMGTAIVNVVGEHGTTGLKQNAYYHASNVNKEEDIQRWFRKRMIPKFGEIAITKFEIEKALIKS